MSLRYESQKNITHYMCDRSRSLTLPMLVNLLLEVSEEQSSELSRDESYLKARGVNWIILRYEFSVSRMPDLKETVNIETRASEYNKLFTYREFVVKDSSGKVLLTVDTTFALMDLSTRKMVRLTDEIVSPYQATASRRIRRSEKPKELTDFDDCNQRTFDVRYFDIDGNGHVNNAHYISWLLDSLPSDFLKSHEVSWGVIAFDKEVSEHQSIDSLSMRRKERGTATDHQIKSEAAVHCKASFTWKKLNKEEH